MNGTPLFVMFISFVFMMSFAVAPSLNLIATFSCPLTYPAPIVPVPLELLYTACLPL